MAAISWQEHCVSAASRSKRPCRCDAGLSIDVKDDSAAKNGSTVGGARTLVPLTTGFSEGIGATPSSSIVADTLTTEIQFVSVGVDLDMDVDVGMDMDVDVALAVDAASAVAVGPVAPVRSA